MCSARLQFSKKHLKDAVAVRGNVTIPDTDDSVAQPFEFLLAAGVAGQLLRLAVRAAVDLDDQEDLATQKVGKVLPNGSPADKLDASKPPVAKMPPELSFSRNVIGSEDTGAVRFPGLRSAHGAIQTRCCPSP